LRWAQDPNLEATRLEESLHHGIAIAALGIELMAVGVIVIAVIVGTARYLINLNQWQNDAYDTYKRHLSKALLLGLEFLVAADIVRTVALQPTLNSVAILAALVAVRTFLSWSLVVETEGHWPWRLGAIPSSEALKKDE
jgi:uncharacterized membrane protein